MTFTQPTNRNRAAYDFYCNQATAETVNVILNGLKRDCDRFDDDNPHTFTASITCATPAEANEVAALFPKFVNVKIATYYRSTVTTVSIRVAIDADKVNKGTNETGRKRITRFIAVCRANGITVEKVNGCTNSSNFTIDDWMAR